MCVKWKRYHSNQKILEWWLVGKQNTHNHILCIGEHEENLLRSGYVTIEMCDYSSQIIPIEPCFLPDGGLILKMMNAVGYSNALAIYPDEYMSNGDLGSEQVGRGSFLNNTLIFKDFADLPMLIDNYKLAMANRSNQRANAERQTVTGRLSHMFDDTSAILSGQGDFNTNGKSLLEDGIIMFSVEASRFEHS